MTAFGQGTGGGPGREPAGDPQDADLLSLAGQLPPGGGLWLLVTEVGGLPGSVFSAYVLPADGRVGRGGDVLIRLAPAATTGPASAGAGVSVWAVISGRLVPVAAWDRLGLEGWPEQVRETAAFAMDIVTELEEHGADLRARDRVGLDDAAATAAAGIPSGLTRGAPGAGPGS